MMKIIRKILAISVVMLVLMQTTVIFAATSSKVILKGPGALQAGTTFEISVDVEGNGLYGVSGEISYSTKSLKYVSASSSMGGTWETEINHIEEKVLFASADSEYKNPIKKTTEILTITFETTADFSAEDMFVKASNVVVSANKKAVNLSDSEYRLKEETEETVETVIITNTKKEEDMYNNNLLESLVVKNATITPEFAPEIQKYEATVPFEIDELEVEAKPVSPKAKIEYVDTKLTYVGKNIVRVKVFSESGLQRTYKIYVERQDKAKTGGNEKDTGLPILVWILIIAGGTVLIAAIVITVIIILKKRKKNA